jgi:glycosyltransferase involved in cell wall biosynthesis
MKILQVFNSYLQLGGEEAAVAEIGEALRRRHEVDNFYGSTRELLGRRPISNVTRPTARTSDSVPDYYTEKRPKGVLGFSRMKILQVFNSYLQLGGEQASVGEIGATLRRHHEVDGLYSSTRKLLGDGWIGKAQAPFKAIWNRDAFDKLRRLQRERQFDVWLVHNVFPGLSPAVYDAARLCNVPVVQYLHNYRFGCINGSLVNHGEPCVRCLNGNFLPAVQTRCWRESRIACATMAISLHRLRAVGVLRQVVQWIAISHAQKQIHIQFGIPGERITVLYHFYRGPLLGRPVRGRDVLFVGRLSQEKGVQILIEAWKEIEARDRFLWIVGEGPLRDRLEELAGSCPNIRFTGLMRGEELRERWLNAAISVVPSIWEEPFGRVLTESWAHGVPVVAARIGALPELIKLTAAGWLFDAGSSASLANLLQGLLSDESAISTVAAKCHEAISKFSEADWLGQIDIILEGARNGTGASQEKLR